MPFNFDLLYCLVVVIAICCGLDFGAKDDADEASINLLNQVNLNSQIVGRPKMVVFLLSFVET